MSDFKEKKVLIMGLGLLGGGVGAARFFAKKGARVIVTDLKTKNELLPSIQKLKDLPIKFILGRHRIRDFEEAELVIRNPDVLPDSSYLKVAQKRGIPVEMAESFFAKNSGARIIGVTGTRGKSTTAALLSEILRGAKLPAVLAGNVPGSSTLELLDKATRETLVVLELSSFQLQGFEESKVSPQIAVITNIYPEHLNHYKTFQDYLEDKKNIFKFQKKNDFLILNKNNKYTQKFAQEAKSQVVWFKEDDVLQGWQLKLVGSHNRQNIAAAIAVASLLKIPFPIIEKTVKNFNPLPYHLELVRKINNVAFINDGVSTSPEATIAAIRSFDKKVLLILGGNDKLLSFDELAKLASKKAGAIFLMNGTATPKIKSAIIKENLVLGVFDNLEETILAAYKYAKKGDIILFSPAATSFNWFNNIYHRSQEFEKIVKSL